MRFLLFLCLLWPSFGHADAALRLIGAEAFRGLSPHDQQLVDYTAHETPEMLVKNGLKIDLLVTARGDWLDQLAKDNLIQAESRTVIGQSPLVVVGKTAENDNNRMIGLRRWWQQNLRGQKLVMGYPAPALQHFFQTIRLDIVPVTATSAWAALAMLRQDKAGLAIVSEQDFRAANLKDFSVLATLPPEIAPPIVIEAVIPTRAPNAEGAAVFLEQTGKNLSPGVPLPDHS